jgi:hypothetical protein
MKSRCLHRFAVLKMNRLCAPQVASPRQSPVNAVLVPVNPAAAYSIHTE